jgi:hypothetical protein
MSVPPSATLYAGPQLRVPESTASLGKYDAAKTLEGFSINLCNEMNLESLVA